MSFENLKIVFVDDDLEILNTMKNMLDELGLQIVTYSGVFEAVKYIETNASQIIMIVSDLRMDKCNGLEFKKMLQEKNIEIPFVLTTGYVTDDISANANKIGIDAIIEKPLSLEAFQEQLTKLGEPRAQILAEEKEMIQGFLEESAPMLDEIESLILELEQDPSSEDTLGVYFRLLHTIKGTASCVGLTNLGNYTHKYEDFIGELRTKKIAVNTQSTNVLLTGLDDLKIFFKQIEHEGSDLGIQYQDKVGVFDTKTISNAGNTSNFEMSTSQVKPETSSYHTDTKHEDKKEKEDDKMSVPMNILNDFMEESGELTVIRNTIIKTVKKIEARYRGDQDIESLNDLLSGMHDVTSNIQGKITQMRQVPLSSTFRPFKRLVRDLSKKLNKSVDFIVHGDEISVDTKVAKLFSNTLIHVVRNSLDHGLETPKERLACQKSQTGRLEFKVEIVGEDIELKIIDDGRGINPAVIREKALEKGLYTENELNQMSELEIINIIFASGFSTAEQVSDLSGRGVGMDMVRGSFEEMGGEIYVKSKPGLGSTFNLKVPIPKSVLIINTLSVCAGGQTFIFKMDDVSEVIRYEQELPNSKLYTIDNQKIINHNSEMIQILPLSQLLHVNVDHDLSQNGSNDQPHEVTNIVVLRFGKSKFGVEVEKIYEFEEVVSRKIPQGIDVYGLYSGASLLGSGEISMIIDPIGLAKYAHLKLDLSKKRTSLPKDEVNYNTSAQEFMLFKYDNENYLSIELEHVDRLETMNTGKFESVGDNIVVNYMSKPLRIIDPAFVLGLSKVNKIETYQDHNQNDVSTNEDVSLIVVSNQQGQQFGVLVNQLDEIQYTDEEINSDTIDIEGLKGSVFINNKTICVIDVEALACLLFTKKPLNAHRTSDNSLNEESKQAA